MKNCKKPAFAIRVHLTDGSVESFAPTNEAEAQKLWDKIEPSRLFAQPRIVLAGEHFKSVFATEQILRVDFIQDTYECWKFPGGYSDVVELSEAEFRKHARLDQPELMAKREQPTPVGDLLVSFLKLHLAGSKPLFLMIEFPVKPPDENLSFMQIPVVQGRISPAVARRRNRSGQPRPSGGLYRLSGRGASSGWIPGLSNRLLNGILTSKTSTRYGQACNLDGG